MSKGNKDLGHFFGINNQTNRIVSLYDVTHLLYGVAHSVYDVSFLQYGVVNLLYGVTPTAWCRDGASLESGDKFGHIFLLLSI